VSDTLTEYLRVVRRKARRANPCGLTEVPLLNPHLFDFQSDALHFLLESGSAAAFLDTGLGKSIIELDWGRVIAEHTGLPVLMLAPLAVGPQHEREAQKFGIEARYIRDPRAIAPGVNITNYERLHLFRPEQFGGIVLDESSIVKSFGGKTSTALMKFAAPINYRLAATATPAPNDHMELGQHSQFLGVMESNEMLARWFIADQSEMGRYRLKRYGVDDFWSWVASWARMARMPSDLGYDDAGFALPELRVDLHYVDADLMAGAGDGELFRHVDTSATSIHKEKRLTAAARATRIAELVAAEPDETWCIWCDTDYEQDELKARIPEALDVRGSQPSDEKESKLVAFSTGQARIIITKPSIAGYGLNWQHCQRCAFVGISFSYESYYQAVRRFWRFGQQRPVQVHIALAETEGVIWQTIQRKARDHETMKRAMSEAMHRAIERRECRTAYRPTQRAKLPTWLAA
jgi:hypothetical protein